MRFYGFRSDEIVDDTDPNLDLEVDPKLAWALRHPECFPVDVNRADYELILRVPGIGVKSAQLIVTSRRYHSITASTLRKMGVVMKRAQYFLLCRELPPQTVGELNPLIVRQRLINPPKNKKQEGLRTQLTFTFPD